MHHLLSVPSPPPVSTCQPYSIDVFNVIGTFEVQSWQSPKTQSLSSTLARKRLQGSKKHTQAQPRTLSLFGATSS